MFYAGAALSSQPVRARTIFQRALEASKLTWRDKHLQLILRHDLDIDEADKDTDMFDSRGIPLWHGTYYFIESRSLEAVHRWVKKSASELHILVMYLYLFNENKYFVGYRPKEIE